jgi:hypothetical protein
MFTYTFCHPASTTLPIDKLSFVSSLCTLRLSLPAFWMTCLLLVGLQSAIFSVSAPATRSLLPVFMQATCLCSGDTELTVPFRPQVQSQVMSSSELNLLSKPSWSQATHEHAAKQIIKFFILHANAHLLWNSVAAFLSRFLYCGK